MELRQAVFELLVPSAMATFYSISLLLVATASSFPDGIKNNNDNIETLLKIPTQCNQANVVKNTKSFGFPSVNQEDIMSPPEIIISRGYHVEMHQVTTEDGYILMLHRIPYPKGQNSGPIGRPVLLQHGVIESSADWVLNPSDKSLAFILADLGYDVWLGNSRGNTYSRGHVTLDSDHDDAYWNFSFDEMGRYDMPALINHVLGVTGREKLLYIGFSAGTRVFFICMHYHPELNDKIELMVAMSPATVRSHVTFPLLKPFEISHRLLRDRVFASSNGLYSEFVKKYCLKNAYMALICHNIRFFTFGHNYENMNPSMIKVVKNHLPAGTSLRYMVHVSQNSFPSWRTPSFNQYNYGWAENQKRYGQRNPPAYDLSKVTTPVYVFYGKNDQRISPKDVEWTVSKLPNVKQVVQVNDPRFNHIDFVFHRNVKVLVYDQIIALLPPPY